MSSPAVIDIERLLTPLSDDQPTGSDIRTNSAIDSPYSTLKDARSSARAAERTSMFDGNSDEASQYWRQILDLAPNILTSDAKDLEVASWYTEALIRRYGFQGLRDGFSLIAGLIENYWDNLYPEPDEDGVITRVAPLTGLNGEGSEGVLIAPIRNCRITEDTEPGPFMLWQYKQTLDVQKIADDDSRNESISKLGYSLSDVEAAVNNSSESFYVDLRDDIKECLSTYRAINQMLIDKCGNQDSPPTSNIINTLDEALGVINHVAKHKFPVEIADSDDETASDGSGGQSQSAVANSGPIKTRDDAFRKLHDIAEFFRKTEPHSPISYVIDKAVKWGGMPLGDLISELIPDSASREFYSSLTGVRAKEE